MNKEIFSGYHGQFHCQGIAIDEKKGFIYYCFTTSLIKTDLDGKFIGSVINVAGHLGCIDFNEKDGKVYASLEYLNDEIGRGILGGLGIKADYKDIFYCAIFDVDRIDRADMDAAETGIMKTVYLSDPTEDYDNDGLDGKKHRYGCSGIDGTDWGFVPGTQDYRLNICYGIYSDLNREDNDYQIIVSYDAKDWWEKYAKPVELGKFHFSGPEKPERKLFVYTGNTNYGVQNLEADKKIGDWYLAVYHGKKQGNINPEMFIVDGKIAPKSEKHKATGEDILTLTLKGVSTHMYGTTGIQSLSDGNFMISHEKCRKDGECTYLRYTYKDLLEAIPVYNKENKLSIFAVGNSFSIDAMRYLNEIFKGEGFKDVVLGNMYIPACSLETHANNLKDGNKDYIFYHNDGNGWKEIEKCSLEGAIKTEKWDIITLQQCSALSGVVQSFEPYLSTLAKWERENAPRLLWHSTWAYADTGVEGGFKTALDENYQGDTKEMYKKILETGDYVGSTGLFDGRINSVKAIERAKRTFGDCLFRDGGHLSEFGSLVAGYAWYRAITGRNIEKVNFVPENLGIKFDSYLETAFIYIINHIYYD